MVKKSNSGSNRILFIYSSHHLSGSLKTRFFYALKGRNKTLGLIDNKSIIQLSKGVILTDLKNKEKVESFLNFWKCNFYVLSSQDIENKVVLKYNSSHLSGSNKVRFFYALKGRGLSQGIIARTESIQLAKSILIVPLEKMQDITEFFRFWKCKFEVIDLNA